MKYVLITGSSGLVGSESSIFFHNKNFKVLGIDNDSRSYFFGSSASTKKTAYKLRSNLKNYQHFNIDIRNKKNLEKIFKKYRNKIKCIIHTAAQPSHDWAGERAFDRF
jgi:CDP-paratose 2-epimerase